MNLNMETDVTSIPMVNVMQENQVGDMLRECFEKYQGRMSVQSFEFLLRKYEITYDILPKYLKDKLDEVDVY